MKTIFLVIYGIINVILVLAEDGCFDYLMGYENLKIKHLFMLIFPLPAILILMVYLNREYKKSTFKKFINEDIDYKKRKKKI